MVSNVLETLTPDTIDNMAKKISALSAKEGNSDNLKLLKKLLKENETATANLIKAIESGKNDGSSVIAGRTNSDSSGASENKKLRDKRAK